MPDTTPQVTAILGRSIGETLCRVMAEELNEVGALPEHEIGAIGLAAAALYNARTIVALMPELIDAEDLDDMAGRLCQETRKAIATLRQAHHQPEEY
jgi:hypothetical protein